MSRTSSLPSSSTLIPRNGFSSRLRSTRSVVAIGLRVPGPARVRLADPDYQSSKLASDIPDARGAPRDAERLRDHLRREPTECELRLTEDVRENELVRRGARIVVRRHVT